MAVLETPAECLIKIDNKEINYNVSGVQLDQFIDTHHQLTIRIQQVGKKEAAKDMDDPGEYAGLLGKNVTLGINPAGGVVDPARKLEFIGIITDVSLENSIDGLNMILLHAASPTISMDGAERNAHYFDKTASDIIGAIIGNYAITKGKIESTKSQYKFDTQYRETDFDYIMRLAKGSGMFAYYDGREFNLTPANSSSSIELVWRETLGSFKMGLGTAPYEFKSEVYNYEQKKIYTQDSKSISQQAVLSNLSKSSPEASKKIYKDSGFSSSAKTVKDAQTLDRTLQNERSKALGSMIRCTGQSIVPEVGVGGCVKITGMDKLDGQYWVKGIRHIFDESGKYHNTFVCTPLDIAYPEAKKSSDDMKPVEKPLESVSSIETVQESKRKEVVGLHTARVVDLDDPEKLGRVKVSYPWLDSEQTAWLRLMVPHAGKDRGWYVLPELDDEVLIGFEYGNTDHPVVLGCLYNKDNSPMQEAVSKENEVKMFRTRSGNQIVFTDKDGGEKIEISQKDGKNQIVLDLSGPTISITTEGDISVKGKNMSLEADEGITFKASADVKLQGANIEIKADANIKSQAGANNDISGSAQVNVKGGMINLN